MGWFKRYRATIDATPPGAMRPTSTTWWDPSGWRPPVTWVPPTGEFETHWDWDRFTALAIPAVWRARMLISQSVGAMRIGAWRDLVPITPTPPVLAEPNPGEDRANTVAAWVCDLLDHGNAVGFVTGWNAEAKAVSVAPEPVTKVSVGRGPDGRRYYRLGERVYDQSEVFHAKGMSGPGDLRGYGVLETQLSTLGRVRSEADYAAKAFASGVPSGILKVKDPDLQAGSDGDPAGYVTAKGIKKSWHESVQTGDIAVLSELVDFQPLSWSPTDAQMVEARQLSLTDVALMFNLDPYWLGAPAAPMVYQNVGATSLQLSRVTLEFWITVLEAQFSRLLPRGQEARFNRDGLLRDDTTTRFAYYAAGLAGGWLTVEDIRAAEGLAPLDGGGDGLAPVTPLFPDGDPGTNEGMAL